MELVWALLFEYLIVPSIVAAFVIPCAVNNYKKHKEYKETAYYQITHLAYDAMRSDKGRHGEYLTYKHLQWMEKHQSYFLFNAYIPKEMGGTAEIDVIMICEDGVFIFESKNYKGLVLGDEYQRYWIQMLHSQRGHAYHNYFYNPLIQSLTHKRHLQAVVGENVPIYASVVFSEQCNIQNIRLCSDDVTVCNRQYASTLVYHLRCQNRYKKLSITQMQTIYRQLYPYTQVSPYVKEQHLQQVRNQQWMMDSEYRESRCPRCGGKLVRRVARRGRYAGIAFYGCENYPRCYYIQ